MSLALVVPALVGCAGDAPSGPSVAPAPVASGAAVAVGALSSCALGSDSTAYCWGRNGLGTLGNPAVPGDTALPVPVRGGRHYAAIALNATNQFNGPFTACALTADGAADCWGSDPDGLLGPAEGAPCVDSAATPRTTGPCLHAPTRVAPTTPTAVVPPPGAARFADVAAGDKFTCALDATGAAYCWA